MRQSPLGLMTRFMCALTLLSSTPLGHTADVSYRVVADTTTLLPGSNEHFTGLHEALILPSGQVAFIGQGQNGTNGVFLADLDGTIRTIADNKHVLPGQSSNFSGIRSISAADGKIAFTTAWSDPDITKRAWIYDGELHGQSSPVWNHPLPYQANFRYQEGSLWTFDKSADPDDGLRFDPCRIRNGQMHRIVTRGVELDPGSGFFYDGIFFPGETGLVTGKDNMVYFNARYTHTNGYSGYETRGFFSADLSTSPPTYRAIATPGRTIPGLTLALANVAFRGSFSFDGENILFRANFEDGSKSIVRKKSGVFSKVLDFPYVDELGRTVTDLSGVIGGNDGRVSFRTSDVSNSQVSILRPDGADGYTLHRVIGINDLVGGKRVESIYQGLNSTTSGDSIAFQATLDGRTSIVVATLGDFGPTITAIANNPIIGSNSPQTLTFHGSGFMPGCKVRLFDHTNYPHGPFDKLPVTLSPNQMSLSANLTRLAGHWTAQVINPDGSRSIPFGFDVLETPPAPGIQTPEHVEVQQLAAYEAIIPKANKKKLILITHGLTFAWSSNFFREMEDVHSWVGEMKAAIESRLGPDSEWQVEEFYWDSRFFGTNVVTGVLLWAAEMKGRHCAREVILASEHPWEEIHLIGHSAGANVIHAISDELRMYSSYTNVRIQNTFLDPFVGITDRNRSTYGSKATWSDHYFSRDAGTYGGNTQGILEHAWNVDVTYLDPEAQTVDHLSSHGWPWQFYLNSITNPYAAGYEGIGFQRSSAGGNFDPGLPKNRTPLNPGRELVFEGQLYQSTPALLTDRPLSFDIPGINHISSNPFQTSTSGHYMIVGDPTPPSLRAAPRNSGTTNNVWHAMDIPLSSKADLIRFSGEFLSGAESEAIVTISWDGRVIASIDQRGAASDVSEYTFELPRAYDPGTYSFSVRVDTFGTKPASFRLSSLTFGLTGTARIMSGPELAPHGFELEENDGFSLMATSDPTKIYRLESSTNLSDWAPVIDRVYSSGFSQKLTDIHARKQGNRFYRLIELDD